MRRFRRWASIALAVAVLGYLVYALWKGFSDVTGELAAFHWPTYLLVLLLTIGNYALRYFKWDFLLNRLGIHIPHRANLWVFMTGLAMVISPAKAGEIVKPYLVRELTNTPMTRSIPALVTERVTDGLAVISLAAIGVSTYYADSAQLVYGTLGLIAAGLVAISVQPIAMFILGIIKRVPYLEGIGTKLEELYVAMRVCVAPWSLLVTYLISLVAWFLECIGYWLIFRGLQVDNAGIDISTFLYAFSTTIGGPSPGGLGVSDVALVELALPLVDGLTAGQALASSLLIRVATLWFGVGLGAFAMLRIDTVITKWKATHEENVG